MVLSVSDSIVLSMQDMIVDMSLSPSGASLAVIDVAGNLSIVKVPSFRRKKFWSVEELVCVVRTIVSITMFFFCLACE